MSETPTFEQLYHKKCLECQALVDGMPKLARDVQKDTINAVLKMIDPGEPPCDCCTKQPNGHWTWDCNCQNSGDISSAASWCVSKGDYERIAALRPSDDSRPTGAG